MIMIRSPLVPSGTHRRSPRRGLVLAVVLVCLSIALMLATTLTGAVAMRHQTDRLAEYRQQCSYLAESGVQRAAAQLARSADYEGETWEIPEELLASRGKAIVTIRVEPVEGPATGSRIHVEASYPLDVVQRAVQIRERFVPSFQETIDRGDQP
jgi:hypothetical protein